MNPYESEIDMAYEQGVIDEGYEWEERMSEMAAQEAEYMMQQEQLYRDAIDKFGKDTQILKCIEEMAELTQALCKGDHDNIIEEMVDVRICLDQMALIYIDSMESCHLNRDMYNYKLERLRERVIDE